MWGILIYLFFRWVIPSDEIGMITLITVNLIFFPFTRIFVSSIKNFFFADTMFMMTDKGWFIYLFVCKSFGARVVLCDDANIWTNWIFNYAISFFEAKEEKMKLMQ